jgi:hypothetical protein
MYNKSFILILSIYRHNNAGLWRGRKLLITSLIRIPCKISATYSIKV